MNPHGTPTKLEQIRIKIVARCFIDVWCEASAAYWTRRARRFEAVGTPECDEIAVACHNRATGLDGTVFFHLAEAAHDLTEVTDDDLIDRLEPRLRAALEAGDADEAIRLSALVDFLDGYDPADTSMGAAA